MTFLLIPKYLPCHSHGHKMGSFATWHGLPLGCHSARATRHRRVIKAKTGHSNGSLHGCVQWRC
ncbi:hypothetical protein BD410DRAFT_80120 [Rickenella mellea]|uniref:Uncharacterized protein n=1 Tax=Rickenella mellea TaxID=50990 RepID=A0A4Y7PL33_9AGAM|nr:hypothetical protein BD410DRAFT_80120 [Rickenella mellea]